MNPTARSLTLDVLSTARHDTVPVRALVRAGRLFDLSENSLRVALARLCAAGRVERDERGRYRLAPGARVVQRHVAAWSALDQRMVAWRGGWIGLHTAGLRPARGPSLRRHLRALDFLGFHSLLPDLWIRPDNLAGGVADLRSRLDALGLAPGVPVFALRDLDAERERAARTLWNRRALLSGYARGRGALLKSAERLRHLSAERALAESFVVGGRALRQLAFDPLLPEAIVPAAPRRRFIDELRRYDRAGRVYWRSFMKAEGVDGLESPLRAHVIDLAQPPHLLEGNRP